MTKLDTKSSLPALFVLTREAKLGWRGILFLPLSAFLRSFNRGPSFSSITLNTCSIKCRSMLTHHTCSPLSYIQQLNETCWMWSSWRCGSRSKGIVSVAFPLCKTIVWSLEHKTHHIVSGTSRKKKGPAAREVTQINSSPFEINWKAFVCSRDACWMLQQSVGKICFTSWLHSVT